MKLNFQERITLLKLLPVKEDYAGMKEIRRAREILAVSGDEAKEYGDKQSDGGFTINFAKTANVFKEVPFGEWMTERIRDILRKMNEKHELEAEHMSLFEKFVVDYQQY